MNNTTCDIPTITVADSKFLGFVQQINTPSEAFCIQASIKKNYISAAHIPFCWIVDDGKDEVNVHSSGLVNGTATNETVSNFGFNEDGEPEQSCGEYILNLTKEYFIKYVRNDNRTKKTGAEKRGIVLVIVRFFGDRLLGVTCGRLSQCYQSISNLTLHRFFHGNDVSLEQDFVNDAIKSSKYGMGAGDCEVILDILSGIDGSKDKKLFPQKIIDELDFGGFKGNKGEELPRLQNLQADISSGTIPVYRYPGNYRGDEWKTFDWSQTSLLVKKSVENNLKPLYDQEMNHCVSNYYRDGKDFIDHHSDKDLDLDKDAVIVSVSLGDERVLELKRRSMPRDTVRVLLPHGSMLVLGPNTNKLFTHSILKKEGSQIPRLSLTFRNVVTFTDLKTKRLFGGGVAISSREQVRARAIMEDAMFLISFAGGKRKGFRGSFGKAPKLKRFGTTTIR